MVAKGVIAYADGICMIDHMKPKILIIEDEAALLSIYAILLAEQGYEVETAANGRDGYEKIHAGGYDLVLLDIIMPFMNGKEIMQKLTEQGGPVLPNKAVVLLTNLTDMIMIDEIEKMGAQGYLLKSEYTPDVFIEEVKKFLPSKAA